MSAPVETTAWTQPWSIMSQSTSPILATVIAPERVTTTKHPGRGPSRTGRRRPRRAPGRRRRCARGPRDEVVDGPRRGEVERGEGLEAVGDPVAKLLPDAAGRRRPSVGAARAGRAVGMAGLAGLVGSGHGALLWVRGRGVRREEPSPQRGRSGAGPSALGSRAGSSPRPPSSIRAAGRAPSPKARP